MLDLKEQKVQQLPMVNRRFEQVFHRDHRACNCEMPMVSRKWHEALGTFVAVRLCCAAKAIQKIADHLGIDCGALYEVFEFDPGWVWDCDEYHQCDHDNPRAEFKDENDAAYCKRGVPPAWLLKRLRDKGIEVKNLPEGHDEA